MTCCLCFLAGFFNLGQGQNRQSPRSAVIHSEVLAGHDVTRCLATMSLDPEDLDDLRQNSEAAKRDEDWMPPPKKRKEKQEVEEYRKKDGRIDTSLQTEMGPLADLTPEFHAYTQASKRL